RVLAFGFKRFSDTQAELEQHDVSAGLTFVGLQGLIDPPRASAKEAIAVCATAGVLVKMITGDHAVTAGAIADQLGLRGQRKDGRLVTLRDSDLKLMREDELSKVAEHVAVFARVSPEQKLDLVKALQTRGHVVAMTGD